MIGTCELCGIKAVYCNDESPALLPPAKDRPHYEVYDNDGDFFFDNRPGYGNRREFTLEMRAGGDSGLSAVEHQVHEIVFALNFVGEFDRLMGTKLLNGIKSSKINYKRLVELFVGAFRKETLRNLIANLRSGRPIGEPEEELKPFVFKTWDEEERRLAAPEEHE